MTFKISSHVSNKHSEYYRVGRAAVWASACLSALALIGTLLTLPTMLTELDEMRVLVEAESADFKKTINDLWKELIALETVQGVGYYSAIPIDGEHDDHSLTLQYYGGGVRARRFDSFLDRLERKSYKGRARQRHSQKRQFGDVMHGIDRGSDLRDFSPLISSEKKSLRRKNLPLTVKTTTRSDYDVITWETTVMTETIKLEESSTATFPPSSTTQKTSVSIDMDATPHNVKQIKVGPYNGESNSGASPSIRSKLRITKVDQLSAETTLPPQQCMLKGPPGQRGQDGIPGIPGESGQAGRSGIDGMQLDAMQGLACQKCPSGPVGLAGSPGPIGSKGIPGTDGVPGKSKRSRKGKHGPPGEVGEPGKNGDDGIPGLPGNSGIRFLKGEPGEKGEKGVAGPRGGPGPIGIEGPSGEPGEPGLTGHHGMPGRDGVPGPPGILGNSGYPGIDRQYCNCPVRYVFLMALKQNNISVSQYLSRFKKQRNQLTNDKDYLALYRQYSSVPYYRIL